jgi:hypothetical protein
MGDHLTPVRLRSQMMDSDVFFDSISSIHGLGTDEARQLLNDGFVVIPDVVRDDELFSLRSAYDDAMASGDGGDYRVASCTTRLNGLMYRGATFESLYLCSSLLAATSLVIGGPFKLSGMLARTLRPHTAAQELNTDLNRDSDAFPMVGFIVMVDDFREEQRSNSVCCGDTPAGRNTDEPSA